MLTSSGSADILKKMEQVGTPLVNYVNGKIYRGIVTGFNKAFVINGEKRAELIAKDPKSAEIIKLLAVGDDVRKWHIKQSDKWLIFTPIGVKINKYPAIFEHLSQWQIELEKRYDKGKFWWELRACDYYSAFEQPKIIYPDIAKEARFAFDAKSHYLGNTVYFIAKDDLFLLAILNSSIIWSYCKENLTVLGDADKGGRLRFFRQFVEKIPIPPATDEEKETIATLVNYILFLTKELKDIPSHGTALAASAEDKLMLSYFEQLVNAIVLELYLPDELHVNDKYFLKHLLTENLPSLKKIKGNKIESLRVIFKRIFDREHPLRVNIYFLNSVEVVRQLGNSNQAEY